MDIKSVVVEKELIVTALFEDAVYIPGSQTLEDPPEYRPALFEASVPLDWLPDNDYASMSLEEVAKVLDSCTEDLSWTLSED